MSNNKILVLGSNGMLGKMISLYLDSFKDLDITLTSRNSTEFIEKNFGGKYLKFDAVGDNINSIINKKNKFDYVINCIGVIKPKINEKDNNSVNETISLNSYLPSDLQLVAAEGDIRYIQIGTDCVFSGKTGKYVENSFMDAEDLYGKSKIVGEIESTNKLLIRSSIVGPETGKGNSLMNWFLKNEARIVSGFKNHKWNGVTTLNFSKIVEGIIRNDNYTFRTQHLVPKNTISKAELLEEFKKNFKKDIDIKHVDAENIVDRTLSTNNQKLNENLWKLAGYENIPTVQENIEELANSKFSHRIIN